MSHDNHIVDGRHLELDEYGDKWMKLATREWQDPLPPPQVIDHDGINVVRDDLIDGSKCRFADLLVKTLNYDTIVYVQPRVGLAGVSILSIAKRYGKKVVLFMPSSKKISKHQAVCIERGAIPYFRRIAAMPNLNIMAKKWAKDNGACFVPLGLKHPLVTACAAQVARDLVDKHGEPDVMFVATSTGVLVRGLQIGMPNTKFYAVTVSRNMKSGELGRAIPIIEPLAFQKAESKDNLPPFDTVNTYDAKVWKYAREYKDQNPNETVWMWNVGKDPELLDESIIDRTDSYRAWGEIKD